MPGHEVYKITDEQLEEWKKSAQPLLQKWADAVRSAGGDPEKIMKELKASLAQYNATYRYDRPRTHVRRAVEERTWLSPQRSAKSTPGRRRHGLIRS